ncbi:MULTISPECIES: uracil phosphoribosyltransferase [Desulfofundulus]|uniref:Uracil phosphoribosyltransferase n=2 Tax=Desulfofundulus TaxID=2282741 RepID=A0A494WZA4_9FIRM|nr:MULTISPECIES: uracil phosphoribosyltransferase [Desulfofundulus]MDQ0285473.1 uracil phosphoribosyltransferase [Desulfofundulus luciae]RKO67702.1 uracil phosphoribosyltransferase [Desulfofundulus salinum]
MSSVILVRHPLVSDRLRTLRDRETDTELFRRALRELGLILAIEATRHLPTRETAVVTPLGVEARVEEVDSSRCLLVPVLRAGLGFVDSFFEFLPKARVAHVGVARDHDTLEARVYLSSVPGNAFEYDHVFILDPMLATGNSSVKVLELLRETGYSTEKVVLVCGFAVETGIKQVTRKFPGVRIVTAAIDPVLNDLGYIVPGLGDAGDRLFLL